MAKRNQLPPREDVIARAKPHPDGRQKEYSIATIPGLSLVVTGGGTGTYWFRYTVTQSNGSAKPERDNLGRRDQVTFQKAKEEAFRRHASVKAEKLDPVGARRAAVLERATKPTFRELVAERERRSPDSAHARELVGILRYDGDEPGSAPIDKLGPLPFDEVTDELAASIIDKAARRSQNAARKVALAISTCYSRHRELRVRRANPVRGTGISPAPPKAREVMWSDDELVRLWRALNERLDVSDHIKLAIKIGVLTGQRQNEIAGARVDELEIAGDSPRWRIAPSRMKAWRAQSLPLPPQIVTLLQRAIAYGAPVSNEYVFPANQSKSRSAEGPKSGHVHPNTLGHALAAAKALAMPAVTAPHFHDFRRSMTTWLAELDASFGVSDAALDALLAHVPRGVTDTHYRLARLQGPMRHALGLWCGHVEGLLKKAELKL